MNAGPEEAHVWLLDLDDCTLDAQCGVLSPDELSKACGFATPRLRSRYSRCRSAVRTLLAGYTGEAAASLRFTYGPLGKPCLAGAEWHFNVSHSGAKALVAVARRPLGIDLEGLDNPAIDPDELLPLVCNRAEQAALRALGTQERHRNFYELWTRKEAYCKALGLGLHVELPAIGQQAYARSGITQMTRESAAQGWFAYALPSIPGHAASLCLPTATATVRFRVYTAGGR
jgi:4'-phosphopantetheinyl transferase